MAQGPSDTYRFLLSLGRLAIVIKMEPTNLFEFRDIISRDWRRPISLGIASFTLFLPISRKLRFEKEASLIVGSESSRLFLPK
jgi:hypothetical protein